jgi:hypothetical protein
MPGAAVTRAGIKPRTTCGVCGANVGITRQPLPANRGALLRTAGHPRPDGGRCVVTQVAEDQVVMAQVDSRGKLVAG